MKPSHPPTPLSDADLLASFLQKNPAAFELIARRHGPMVLNVCQRILQNAADAEDAFQATFFVLFKKAHTIQPQSNLPQWLYGVAHRSALKSKSARLQMKLHESRFTVSPDAQTPTTESTWSDLAPLLDKEIARLPEKYRLPILLCELQGHSGKDAAKLLNLPEGTLFGRLSRARALLRHRLTRKELTLSIATLTLLLANHAAEAALPTPLLSATIKGITLLNSTHAAAVPEVFSGKVAALSNKVVTAMRIAKLKFATAALLGLALITASGTLLVTHLRADETANSATQTAQHVILVNVPSNADANTGGAVTQRMVLVQNIPNSSDVPSATQAAEAAAKAAEAQAAKQAAEAAANK